MIRLNLSREPIWLDLGHDVRVRVAPLTTSLMAAARSDLAVAALPEGASNETIAVTMAKALARGQPHRGRIALTMFRDKVRDM